MTPVDSRHELYCYRGVRQGVERHGHYVARQWRILEFARTEAARLAIPYTHAEIQAETSTRRELLTEQRKRLGWAVADGLLSRQSAKTRAAAIDAELAALEVRETIVEIPRIDWSAPAAELNAVLQALWERIELDEQLRPVHAVWRVPEWRG